MYEKTSMRNSMSINKFKKPTVIFRYSPQKVLVLFGLLIFLANIKPVFACDIKISVGGKQQEFYQPGDKIIFKVIVKLTHRVCKVAMEKTQFKTEGLKISKATKWKQLRPNIWGRKLVAVVTGSKDGKLSLSAIRKCDKEGGFGSMTLKCAPVPDRKDVEAPVKGDKPAADKKAEFF